MWSELPIGAARNPYFFLPNTDLPGGKRNLARVNPDSFLSNPYFLRPNPYFFLPNTDLTGKNPYLEGRNTDFARALKSAYHLSQGNSSDASHKNTAKPITS